MRSYGKIPKVLRESSYTRLSNNMLKLVSVDVPNKVIIRMSATL